MHRSTGSQDPGIVLIPSPGILAFRDLGIPICSPSEILIRTRRLWQVGKAEKFVTFNRITFCPFSHDVQFLAKASSILRVWVLPDIVSHRVRLQIPAHCGLAPTPPNRLYAWHYARTCDAYYRVRNHLVGGDRSSCIQCLISGNPQT